MLIYDQHCAADARRQRKRGTLPTRTTRVVINEAVCEGCGDCGVKSNCLSVQPVDTEFGRKTRIDQTSCNTDYSCLDGDCPSFVTVEVHPGKKPRTASARRASACLPDLDVEPITATHNVFLAGIGGTGIVTVNQVLATAALRAGYDVESLDQIGLSQKAGPVVSHLRFAAGKLEPSNRLTPAVADCIVAFDLLTAADTKNLGYGDPARTVSVASTSKTPTGDMVYDKSVAYPETPYLLDRLDQVSRTRALLRRAGRRAAPVRQHGRGELPADRRRLPDRGAAASGGSRSRRPSRSTGSRSRPTSPPSAGDASPSPTRPASTTASHPRATGSRHCRPHASWTAPRSPARSAISSHGGPPS